MAFAGVEFSLSIDRCKFNIKFKHLRVPTKRSSLKCRPNEILIELKHFKNSSKAKKAKRKTKNKLYEMKKEKYCELVEMKSR